MRMESIVGTRDSHSGSRGRGLRYLSMFSSGSLVVELLERKKVG